MARVKKAVQENPKTKAGTEITPDLADALAAEAERGYDLSKAKRAELAAIASRSRRLPATELPHDPRPLSGGPEAS